MQKKKLKFPMKKTQKNSLVPLHPFVWHIIRVKFWIINYKKMTNKSKVKDQNRIKKN